MAATPTTRWQVGGYRFLVRRMEHALVRRDVRMLHDPMRSQSRALFVGVVIASVGLAGCAALALLRPQDKIGDADIVVAKSTGAMFVLRGDALHPVLNLASARLIVGKPDSPVLVNDTELEAKPRGALLGIPGAPSDLPDARAVDAATASWTVCDRLDNDGRTASSAIVIGNPVFAPGSDRLKSDDAFLWAAGDGTYLVQNGSRARIDLRDRGVVRALGLEGAQPVPVTAGLLDSVPVSPAIVSPRIEGLGSTPLFPVGGKTVGSVFSVSRRPVDQHYVVLADGIQPITEATALLIEFSDSQGTSEIPLMTPDVLKDAPEVQNELPVSTYPESAPRIVDSRSNPVMCQTWQSIPEAQGGPTATLTLSTGRSLPIDKASVPVSLAQADGAGSAIDEVYSKPGSAEFVQSTDIGTSSVRVDSLFFVADTGVRYGVDGRGAGEALGFGSPAPAPWQIIRLLGNGPTLGRGQASTAHDGVAPDPAAALPVN